MVSPNILQEATKYPVCNEKHGFVDDLYKQCRRLQSVSITTDVSSESRSGRGVQPYVIKFVSDLRQVGGFLRVLQFPPTKKLTATI